MLALSSDEGLCALEFTTVKGRARGEERLSRLKARLARWFPPHEIVDRETPTIARTRRWLAAYFDGTAADISGIPLDMRGAPFEKRVWVALQAIPPGDRRPATARSRRRSARRARRAPSAPPTAPTRSRSSSPATA